MCAYVTDNRNQVIEYPNGCVYDFDEPCIFYGNYLYCVEGQHIYICEEMGCFCLVDGGATGVDSIFLSENYQYIFLSCNEKTLCADDTTSPGELHSEYNIKSCAYSDEVLIGYNGGHLEVMDLFLPVNSASSIKFKPVRINEKKISTKEYERKHFC